MAKAVTSTQPGPRPDGEAGPGRRTGLARDDVVDAAIALVEREGPAALTMRRLATELDVGTPTVYWHAGNRDALVAEIMRRQAEVLAARPIEGATPRQRVYDAARRIWSAAIEHRAITSLAHQTGTTPLLLHRLEVALVAELEAAGLTGAPAAEATRSILVAVSGSLVLALRPPATAPEYAPDALWGGDELPISAASAEALRAEPDLDALSAVTIRAVVDHHVPAGPGPDPSEELR